MSQAQWRKSMGKGRVEAFTDGVIAIIITIMVLELKVPHGAEFSVLAPLWPTFFSYVLSHTVQRVDGRVLWANLHLLFWLSLMPVTTAFMGENQFAPVPVAVYGVVLALCAAAYFILVVMLHRLHGNDTAFARAVGADRKEKISVVLYIAAIPLTFVDQWISVALYVLVAMIWFVPDRRFERLVEK
jgi:uncharacterized membrane protein